MENTKSPAEKKREKSERIDRGLEDFMEKNGFQAENNLVVPSLTPEEFKQMKLELSEQNHSNNFSSKKISGKRTILLDETQEDFLIGWRKKINLYQSTDDGSHIFTDEEIISIMISDLLPLIPTPREVKSEEDLKFFLKSLKISI